MAALLLIWCACQKCTSMRGADAGDRRRSRLSFSPDCQCRLAHFWCHVLTSAPLRINTHTLAPYSPLLSYILAHHTQGHILFNAKHSTATRSSAQSSCKLWDYVPCAVYSCSALLSPARLAAATAFLLLQSSTPSNNLNVNSMTERIN